MLTNLKNIIRPGDALDVLKRLPSESVNCIVTSPPYYGLRDYQVDGQLGLEPTVDEYVTNLVLIFREARRVLSEDGALWLNLGDSYHGSRAANGEGGRAGVNSIRGQEVATRSSDASGKFKPKDLIMVPFRVAIALQADGWYMRQVNIWHKPNCMPESVKDRTTTSHEYVFHLSKSAKYFYNQDAIREPAKDWGTRDRSKGKYTSGDVPIPGGPHKGLTNGNFSKKGRNARSVWTINPKGYSGAHFATMPVELAEKCVKAGCPQGGVVLDPFGGVGTTAIAAINNDCHYVLIELNPEYINLASKRIREHRRQRQAADPFQPTIYTNGEKQLSLFTRSG